MVQSCILLLLFILSSYVQIKTNAFYVCFYLFAKTKTKDNTFACFSDRALLIKKDFATNLKYGNTEAWKDFKDTHAFYNSSMFTSANFRYQKQKALSDVELEQLMGNFTLEEKRARENAGR